MARHTMGHDVAFTKPKYNPDGCPRISGAQVRALAAKLGVDIKREGETWWLLAPDGVWRTLAQTNYWAWQRLSQTQPRTD